MRNWIFQDSDFAKFPVYSGDDLGVFWSAERLHVRIWAPTAVSVLFRLYGSNEAIHPEKSWSLGKSDMGTWCIELPGNYEGFFYTFQVTDKKGALSECPDIAARATGVNGLRGMILDHAQTNPQNWKRDRRSHINNPTDMIIYEVHIRDFTISPDSGIMNKGKYPGFTEKGTKSPQGLSTGLDHLIELGITHIHLLPVADFYTVDETITNPQYNWGYDPLNFNTPEGWYSTNPYDGYSRIRELKTLVKTMHDNGIGVIMDVVYNHSGLIFDSWFNQTVPGYYYRQNEDGTLSDASGCGNEMASERAMVRKFIVDSVAWWAEEYHLDGFRFDLMGIIDIETMNQIRMRLDKVDPNILMYGEGWIAAESPLPESLRAIKLNTPELDRIASFCDDMRDGLKGSPFNRYSHGFISGLTLREEKIKFSIAGAIHHPQIFYDYVDSSRQPWANSPSQCVNYVSCHDNYTLFDKLQYSCPEASMDEIERMTKEPLLTPASSTSVSVNTSNNMVIGTNPMGAILGGISWISFEKYINNNLTYQIRADLWRYNESENDRGYLYEEKQTGFGFGGSVRGYVASYQPYSGLFGAIGLDVVNTSWDWQERVTSYSFTVSGNGKRRQLCFLLSLDMHLQFRMFALNLLL